jgi:hypothetical protein
MFKMCPDFARIIERSTARENRYGPFTFTAIT